MKGSNTSFIILLDHAATPPPHTSQEISSCDNKNHLLCKDKLGDLSANKIYLFTH